MPDPSLQPFYDLWFLVVVVVGGIVILWRVWRAGGWANYNRQVESDERNVPVEELDRLDAERAHREHEEAIAAHQKALEDADRDQARARVAKWASDLAQHVEEADEQRRVRKAAQNADFEKLRHQLAAREQSMSADEIASMAVAVRAYLYGQRSGGEAAAAREMLRHLRQLEAALRSHRPPATG